MRVWGILEGGTSGHTQRAPQGRPLRTPHGPRQAVTVSGVSPRHTFTEACEDGLTSAARELERGWQAVGS
jgi:hypothetical protein